MNKAQAKIIAKNVGDLRKGPNLIDYNRFTKNFSWSKVSEEVDFTNPPGGIFNIASYSIDRHARSDNGNKNALVWISANGETKEFTYKDIFELSNKFAGVLVKHGCQKGDRVFFFLQKVPEAYFGFIGALKTGAIAGTLFPAFGEQALLERLKGSQAKFLVTDKDLGQRVEKIKNDLPDLQDVFIIDGDLKNEMEKAPSVFETKNMDQNDPAIMIFTSSTGNTPVCGIVTPHKAIIQQHLTARWVLDIHDDDIYWCTADPGWVTGAVYGIIAPWSCGVTQIVYAGRFNAGVWMDILRKQGVSVWYTAPTALRMMKPEISLLNDKNVPTLRHICSVGEALPPDLIYWALENFSIPIHDTWWQTETGAMMITNFASLPIKPGSMGKPVPGIEAAIVDDKGKELPPETEGNLAIKPHWPAEMILVWGRPDRYGVYFHDGWYYTGDSAKIDKDGYFWFIGRVDDVIKTSGERVGPFEVESVLVSHPMVKEAGVIGKPDELRGQIIKAFVVLKEGATPGDELVAELQQFVKSKLAGHAYPREIDFIEKLPKTRSGKIMRRLLKSREMGLPDGDTSTLENF